MNRRDILKNLGLFSTLGLAGCSANTPDNKASTPKPTPDPAEQKPIPSKGHVYSLPKVDEENDIMKLVMSDFKMPRPATIELYRLRPTEGDSGEWTYYKPKRSRERRTRLSYNTDPPKVSETKLPAIGNNRRYRPYDINFPVEDEPSGVPLHYKVDLVEHTLDGQRRTLGHTPMSVKQPDTGKFLTPTPTGIPAVVGTFDGYTYNRETTDGDAVVTVVGSSNDTRWHTPRVDYVANRPNKVGKRKYTRGEYERRWAVNYEISKDTFETWHQWNTEMYSGELWDPSGDVANLYRLIDQEYHGKEVLNNDTLARVAQSLNETAEGAGLTTPLKKLRFIADFVQRIPYTDDSQIPDDKPRVQHPITTLYKMTGDCEDKVALTMSLLWQDSFPDYNLASYYISTPPHVGVAVEKDILGDAQLDSIGDRNRYLYMEVTVPAPLGMYIEQSSTPHINDVTPPGHPTVKEH